VIRCPAGNNDADDRIPGAPSGREAILNFSGAAKIWPDREAIWKFVAEEAMSVADEASRFEFWRHRRRLLGAGGIATRK
jgi:hypothetical protein